MSDNLVLEHLRAIRTDVADIKVDMFEVKGRLGMIEAQYSSLSQRVDRLTGDVEQINRRLEIVPAF